MFGLLSLLVGCIPLDALKDLTGDSSVPVMDTAEPSMEPSEEPSSEASGEPSGEPSTEGTTQKIPMIRKTWGFSHCQT